MFRHKVKFTDAEGVETYGYYRNSGPEVDKAKRRGLAVVDDAVLPRAYLVPLADVEDVESEPARYDAKKRRFVGGDVVEQHEQREYEKAKKLSASLPQDGKVRAGAMFEISVADGRAPYVVVSVGKRTCRVEWRGFGGDRYRDHHFGLGGSFLIRDVARYVTGDQMLRSIFGGGE